MADTPSRDPLLGAVLRRHVASTPPPAIDFDTLHDRLMRDLPAQPVREAPPRSRTAMRRRWVAVPIALAALAATVAWLS